MEWSKNNLSCTNTWSNLLLLRQLKQVFIKAGKMPMSKLLFYNTAASPEMLNTVATALALQLDALFTELDDATYDKGITSQKAIEAMKTVLIISEKTIFDLAVVVDNCYDFSGVN